VLPLPPPADLRNSPRITPHLHHGGVRPPEARGATFWPSQLGHVSHRCAPHINTLTEQQAYSNGVTRSGLGARVSRPWCKVKFRGGYIGYSIWYAAMQRTL